MPRQPVLEPSNLYITDKCPWCTNKHPEIMFSGPAMSFKAKCLDCGKKYKVSIGETF